MALFIENPSSDVPVSGTTGCLERAMRCV
jgi:hypothetical protein